MQARLADAASTEPQLKEQLNAATEKVTSLTASLELARKRVQQNTELVAAGAGSRFDLEQAETNVRELTAQIAAARAAEQEIREKLLGRFKGDLSTVAQVKAQIATAQAQLQASQAQVETTRAQLENARWDLLQTTVLAPGNGTMVNVMLRPGYFVAGMPFNEVMTFVDDEYQIFALFGQNELHQVAPGNEAEITLDTFPGRIIKAHVDSVIWAQAQGQVDASGNLPEHDVHAAPGPLPRQARRRREGSGAVPRRRRARRGGGLHRASVDAAHHPQSAAAGVVVFDYIIIKHSFSGH